MLIYTQNHIAKTKPNHKSLQNTQQIAPHSQDNKGGSQMAKNFFYNEIYALDFTLMDKKDSLYVLQMRNHAQVAQYMYSSHISKQGHTDFIKGLKNNQKSAYWLLKKRGEILGVASLSRINLTHKNAYIGIYKNPFLDACAQTKVLAKSTCTEISSHSSGDSAGDFSDTSSDSFAGISVGAEILVTLEHIAFSEFCLHSLHLEVLESNAKAIRFYEKNGYKYGGKLVDFIYRNEFYHNALLYSKISPLGF